MASAVAESDFVIAISVSVESDSAGTAPVPALERELQAAGAFAARSSGAVAGVAGWLRHSAFAARADYDDLGSLMADFFDVTALCA